MKLIITRHGETEENKAGILQGHLPGKLSPYGKEQARKVALRLKEEKLDYIYSSDLERAVDTTKEIIKYHSTTPIKFVENLRERNLGEFQGKKRSDFESDAQMQGMLLLHPKDGETREDVYNRAKSFLQEIIQTHHRDSILFVCHGGVGLALIAVITGKAHSEIMTLERLRNTSISIFEIEENGNSKILCYNCIKHLE
jgi:broad specificity phosphatase PhoE